MNLLDLQENKKSKLASRVLKETYNIDLKLNKLSAKQANTMLRKVRGLITETRTSKQVHSSHRSPEYLKLLMMEQALSDYIRTFKSSRIVVENEEVQKSQVILAAQDMIDSIQKMVEQVSKMNAEELPAVVQGIQNEIGSNESEQFNSAVGENLKTLQAALETARNELNTSLGGLTGEAAPAAPAGAPAGELRAPELEAPPMGGEELEMGSEELPELPEEPEEIPSNLGRERR
jgi:hypothetical protein